MLGKKPSSASATELRGTKNEEARFMPPIETKVPAETIARAIGPIKIPAASAIGASLFGKAPPNIPILTSNIRR